MSNIPPPVGLASGTEATGDIHEGPMPTEAATSLPKGAYPNRSDLRSPKQVKFASDPRHPAIQDSARPPLPPNYHQLPSTSPGQLPIPPAALVPGQVSAPTELGRFGAAMTAAKGSPLGAGPGLAAPSAAPGEHVMTGAPVGPGAGPGVLGILPGQGSDPHAVLNALQSRYSDPDMTSLLKQGAGADNSSGIPVGATIGGAPPNVA